MLVLLTVVLFNLDLVHRISPVTCQANTRLAKHHGSWDQRCTSVIASAAPRIAVGKRLPREIWRRPCPYRSSPAAVSPPFFAMPTAALLLVHTLAVASRRRSAARTLSQARWPSNDRCDRVHCSEQIHIALGGPCEMVVTFVTLDEGTPSVVRFAGPDRVDRNAVGTVHTYSQLQWIDPMLPAPAIGTVGASIEEIRYLQSYEIKGGSAHHKPPHVSSDGLAYGLAQYNNPAMFYDSPLIHRVTLSPLNPGALSMAGSSHESPNRHLNLCMPTSLLEKPRCSLDCIMAGDMYTYNVSGDERVFSFRMPPGEALPMIATDCH